ncbi:hypothetical protein Tco_0328052 [Tanacetum coccineum]
MGMGTGMGMRLRNGDEDDDKRKVTQMKIQDLLEKRIEKAGHHLNKEKQIMHINKGKEKMVMKKDVVIIESDTSYDYIPGQTTSNESSDHNPFQVTSDDTSDDTLKSSPEDTCSSDSVTTWKQILNKEFRMKSSKENVRGSSNVRMKGKRNMLLELQFGFAKLVHVFVKLVYVHLLV